MKFLCLIFTSAPPHITLMRTQFALSHHPKESDRESGEREHDVYIMLLYSRLAGVRELASEERALWVPIHCCSRVQKKIRNKKWPQMNTRRFSALVL
jgi:hypothetical protein